MLKKSASKRTAKMASLTLISIETLKDFSNLISFNVNCNSNHSKIIDSYNLVAFTLEAIMTLLKYFNFLSGLTSNRLHVRQTNLKSAFKLLLRLYSIKI